MSDVLAPATPELCTLEALTEKHISLLEAYQTLHERIETLSPVLSSLRDENSQLHQLVADAVDQLEEKDAQNDALLAHIESMKRAIPTVRFDLPTDLVGSDDQQSTTTSDSESETVTTESDTSEVILQA